MIHSQVWIDFNISRGRRQFGVSRQHQNIAQSAANERDLALPVRNEGAVPRMAGTANEREAERKGGKIAGRPGAEK
jgi:hypothetical protein